MILLGQNAIPQIKPLLSPRLIKERQVKAKMYSDINDSWGVQSFSHGFHLFAKYHAADSTDKTKNVKASIGYYGNATITRLNGIKQIELAVTDISLENADKYLYHVVVNDSIELVHWTKPSVFRSNKFIPYAYLGKFDCLNKIIKLEIYEVNNYKHKVVMIFNGGYMPAPQINYVSLKLNNKYLFDPDKQEYIPNSRQRYFIVDSKHQQSISFDWSDSINYLTIQMTNTLQNDMYQVFLKGVVDGKQIFWPIGNHWEQTYYSPNPELHINASYFKKPGKYTIIIKPKMPDGFKESGKEAQINFTVLPGPISIPMKTVAYIILIILTTGGFMFMMYRRSQKQKLVREAQNRQIATLQLQSVRAQLNPHFIFNALAGIQNLINKNAIEDANKYLTRFARLTRNALDEAHKDLICIEQEISLLDDYMQMEQTRFGFKFSINVAGNVDKQIEIPAMLIQPFAENAVKHGISSLKDKGLIAITIEETGSDIILTINDNGKGFNKPTGAGRGIKLCEDRISLLNSIYKKSTILLRIEARDEGTTITIHLKNWL